MQLVATADREAIGHFLRLPEYINLAIPRGGEGLIRRVAPEAKMPVIKHFTGNCHVYLDRSADPDMAERLVVNAKCQRMGVCNAAESLLVHAAVADALLPRVARALVARGDRDSRRRADAAARARGPAGHRRRLCQRYLGPMISVKVVDSLDEAIEHVHRYGSQHTDAIVTADLASARRVYRPRRQLRGDGQRQHAIQRRRRVRSRGGDRHQHRQVPRPRPVRTQRA